jgi:hypothetical protein
LFCFSFPPAIASIEASPLVNNVTENMILRTFDGAPQGRIINGVESKLFSRPYQASLQLYVPSRDAWFHFCGAVVIGRSLVCTDTIYYFSTFIQSRHYLQTVCTLHPTSYNLDIMSSSFNFLQSRHYVLFIQRLSI